MILAAGEGTRLRPVTKGEIPKPMVDLGAGPMILHTVNRLVEFGVDEIVINLHHKGEKIQGFFGDRWRGTPIHYAAEDELLGTAGGVRNVADRFDEPFLLFYGDILTDMDLDRFVTYHDEKDADLTMLVYEEDRKNLPEASIVLTDDEERVTRMIEKPSPDTIERYAGRDLWTNGSVFVINPAVIERIPDGFADFGKDVLPGLVDDGAVYAYPVPDDTYWHEVGNPERYEKAVNDIASGTLDFRGQPGRG